MKKSEVVQIRLTEDQKNKLIHVGKRYPKGYSEFLRHKIDAEPAELSKPVAVTNQRVKS